MPIRAAASDFEARRLLRQRARAIGEKEVQCLFLHCSGTEPVPYRSQESISVLSRSSCPLRWFGMLTAEVAEITEFEPKNVETCSDLGSLRSLRSRCPLW